jgi:lipid-binding SYLF domain-containing protein
VASELVRIPEQTMVSRRVLTVILLFSVLGLSLHEAPAQDDAKAAKTRGEIDGRAEKALAEFLTLRGGQALFDRAKGYAVFRVTKGGLGASGAGGRGVAIDKSTGKRVYMGVGSAGVGFTFGVSRYDIVILFETTDKIAAFTTGGWDSSATAQAAAGSKGAEIGSTFFNGVAYYQLARKGLMASADVSGTRFFVLDDLN